MTVREYFFRELPPLVSVALGRCSRCKRWGARTKLGGEILGWSPRWCGPCLTTLTVACMTRHGRLPTSTECYCQSCGEILPVTNRASRDSQTGSQKRECIGCQRAKAVERGRRNRLHQPASLKQRP